MSVSSEKKLKQALLQFNVSSNDKKRKLNDDTNFDEVKCRKLNFGNSAHQNQQSVDTKKDLVNGNLKAIDDASATEISTLDLTSEDQNSKAIDDASAMDIITLDTSDDSGDENSCPRNTDTSLTIALPSTPETPKCRTAEAVFKSANDCSTPGTKSVENSAEKVLSKKITPKPSKESTPMRKEERERLKQEKERLKEEREKERLAKLEAKELEKRQKEEERKAKEEEKRQKAQAKEEERRQKEEERKAKEEEKRQKAQAKEEERRQKEEERKAKEEEKRQKEEEKRVKEEEKRQKEVSEKKKKEKSAALFTNFFLKNKNTSTKNQPTESSEKVISTKFMPFEVKENMRLASVQRVVLNPEKLRYLDEILSHDCKMNLDSLYLATLRSKSYVPGHSDNTWPLNVNDDDDEIQDVTHKKYRCKLLQFRENRRPAYWGTWRKRSKAISGRRPFQLDTTYFEYEIDSDDEWVDEEPGESLGGSEDDLESEDDYEVDNDMFVPHGYLSDEEGQPDEVPEGSPKSHKQKLNILEKQFEAEMKEKTSKLKPRVYGCIWISNDVEKTGRDDVENMLLTYRAVWNEDRTPFRVNLQVENSIPTPSSKSKSIQQSVPAGVLKEFPESLMPDLIKLVHGNKLSGQKLVDEFKLYALSVDAALNLTKSCLFNKIREIASWIPNLACWMVNDDVRQQYNLSDLSPTENRWKYISNFESTSSKKTQNAVVSVEKSPSAVPPAIVTTPTSSGNRRKTSSITKFIRVYRASDKNNQPSEPTTPELEK